MRDKIADLLREWDERECYTFCRPEKPCKYCAEAATRADTILALEVEGKIYKCAMRDLWAKCEDCRGIKCDSRVIRFADLIGGHHE